MLAKYLVPAACLLVAQLVPIGTAAAQQTTSVYTRIDDFRAPGARPALCRVVEHWGDEEANPVTVMSCPPFRGYKVTVVAINERTHVYFGGPSEPDSGVAAALFQTPVGGFFDPHHTIEWRLHGPKPVAAIQRYFGDHAQALTVHKLNDDGTSCVAAVVGVVKGRDANQDAVMIADTRTPGFRCGKDEPIMFAIPRQTSQADGLQ